MGNGYQKTFALGDTVIYRYFINDKLVELLGEIKYIQQNQDGNDRYKIRIHTRAGEMKNCDPYLVDIWHNTVNLLPDDRVYYPKKNRFYIAQEVEAVAQSFGGRRARCLICNVYPSASGKFGSFARYDVYCIDDEFKGVIVNLPAGNIYRL